MEIVKKVTIGDLVIESSFRNPLEVLWIGDRNDLNRKEIAELVAHLQAWLTTGSLEVIVAKR